MPRRPRDWLRQAELDLAAARELQAATRYESAAFFAHQAAEKAVKAMHEAEGAEARGHSLVELLGPFSDVPSGVADAARRLDRHYIGARYPNAHPAGAPGDLYTELDAEQALRDAEAVVVHAQGHVPPA